MQTVSLSHLSCSQNEDVRPEQIHQSSYEENEITDGNIRNVLHIKIRGTYYHFNMHNDIIQTTKSANIHIHNLICKNKVETFLYMNMQRGSNKPTDTNT